MRCVSILGPSQSGKSTLARQLATLDGAPAASEALDPFHLTTFGFLGEAWCAIDMPGGAEFTVAAEGALMASDAAVLVVPPEPESSVLCAPWLRAIEAAKTPCLIFINKMDAAQARLRDIIGALQGYSDHTLVLRQIPMREGERVVGAVDLISERAWRFRDGQQAALVELPDGPVATREAEAREALLEHMSEYDDPLLEELIEDRIPPSDALYAIARRETAGNVLIPAFMGAAERSHGVTRLMKALRHEVPAHDVLGERLGGAGAVALHAALRRHMGRIVALRALDGTIAASAPLAGGNIGGLNQIGGGGAGTLSAGAVGLAVKSDHLPVLYPVGEKSALPRPAWAGSREPMLARVLIPASERDEVRLSGALARLAECDAHLVVEPEEETGQPVLRVQGAQHLRRVLATLEAEFGLAVETRLPQPPWRETISQRTEIRYRHRKQSGGAGQFADVVMIVEPLPRGEGFRFSEVVKGGAVPRNYIPAVEEGVREAMARGPLGFAVTDIAVTLTDGKHHAVDSSEHAFRTAGRMGLREALGQAGPLLLQGIERIDIQVPSVFSGTLVSLVSGLKGQVLGFEGVPDCRGWDLFRATLPAGTRDELLNALAGATQGTAWIAARFDHFEEIYGKEAEAVSKARLAALA